ncbi:MAG: hypothetical protein ACREDS_16090, partial [Limisphaerales bacterium]
MASFSSVRIYVAVRNQDERSQIEDHLVSDGANVSAFKNAQELWNRFQERPARFVIADHKFGSDFGGLDLTRRIRKNFSLPYVYILMRDVFGADQANSGRTFGGRGKKFGCGQKIGLI